MAKTIVYLIRHSEQLKINGIKNIAEDNQISNEKITLTVNGENKAKELSELVELSNIDVLWSSNYVRAISTAKYIANKNNILINIDSNFNERKLGDLKTLEELGKSKKQSFTTEQLLNPKLKNIGGESIEEVNERMANALNKIIEANEGKRIAIVSHGIAIKSLLMNWCTLDEEQKLIYRDNIVVEVQSPGVIKLEFDRDKLIDLSIIY